MSANGGMTFGEYLRAATMARRYLDLGPREQVPPEAVAVAVYAIQRGTTLDELEYQTFTEVAMAQAPADPTRRTTDEPSSE